MAEWCWRSIRLAGYDYASPGAYFVTICVQDRMCAFGDVTNGVVRLNGMGEIVRASWQAIPDHFQDARLDAFVVMPNHVHGIVIIDPGARAGDDSRPRTGDAPAAVPVRATHASPQQASPQHASSRARGPIAGGLGAIVGSFKSASARLINGHRGAPGAAVWQRNYHERIIRDEDEFNRIRGYIADNPVRWAITAGGAPGRPRGPRADPITHTGAPRRPRV